MRSCDASPECTGFVAVGGQLRLQTSKPLPSGYAKREPLVIGLGRRTLISPPDACDLAWPGALEPLAVFATLPVKSGTEARLLCVREPRCVAYAVAGSGPLGVPDYHAGFPVQVELVATFASSFGGVPVRGPSDQKSLAKNTEKMPAKVYEAFRRLRG
ncbi:hypothetical protein T492DRAFT_949631 [Pavlovales sp. CCMP2436]|nr:hypothetical protein T492DRAFT_949631 [Pavlovales sp. CCMP2436]|mmetsp:Transcript_33578/g.79032  ORF Transcript_33578/g.79032 Transcript_33578/m.79032 type:complete len:158 (+) Transcript_33578:508-981(+)